MDREIIEFSAQEFKRGMHLMIAKDEQYNNGHTPLSYLPKGWASCYTYLNEQVNRMDSLMVYYEKNPSEAEKMFWDKWTDLLMYTLLSGKKMREQFDRDKSNHK